MSLAHFRPSRTDLFNKMKKKPELQAVLDKLDTFSVEDINQLNGKAFPKWVKQHLCLLKNSNADKATQEKNYRAAHEIAAKMVEYSKKNM